MWQRFKEQLPAIIVTSALVIAAAAIMVRNITERQRAELAPLLAQNESLRAQADENRRQIEATTKLLKDALTHNGGQMLGASEGVEKINEERLTRLAEVIAKRVIPAIPAPQSAADLEKTQNEQMDKVADRLAANIKPVLAEAVADQRAATAAVKQQGEARIQQLNVGLLAAQAAAQDALKLSREISALYADSSKDQGVIMRLFSLPANLVIDAAQLNFVGSDRAKIRGQLSEKTNEIEKRLREIQTLAASGSN